VEEMEKEKLLEKIKNAIEDTLYIVKEDILYCWKEMLESGELEKGEIDCDGCEYTTICETIVSDIEEEIGEENDN
jgi:hypothetical protein